MSNSTAVDAVGVGHSEPLADLVARVDLCELVARDAGPGRQISNRTTYRCPNAAVHTHGDRTPSFTVTDTQGRQRWRCWGACQTGGDALDYVRWRHGLDTTAAIRWLRDYTGTAYLNAPTASRVKPAAPASTTPTAPLRTPPEPTGERPPDDIAADILERYCSWRGWPLEVAHRHGLYVVKHGARLYCRHPFYVPTATGPVMFGWQDRALYKGASAKWRAPDGWPLPLWGTPSLITSAVPAVVLCEGPADGLSATYALEEYGPIAVVAAPGVSTWRPAWTPLFTGLHVVIAADPDNAGDRLAERLEVDLAPVAASIGRACRQLLTTDVTDALRQYGPDYVAAALLTPLDAVGVV
jgi:hypothetical protein